jgi:polyisoprenyl-teichoic acid--peptidoglycan teichoic acid transferase
MHRKVQRFFLPKSRVTLFSIGLFVALVFLLFSASKMVLALGRHGFTPGNIYKILFSKGVDLNKADGRINVLLLGVGGDGHEGGDLTDTMIIMSLDESTRSMALISIPRDVWSDSLKDKVNSAYHYGEEQNPGGGLPLAKAIVEEITGVPIQYGVLFDFSVFSDAVDFVGGIDIDVTSPFTDTQYPIAGKENDACAGDPEYLCRYQTVTFGSGVNHMDGARALEYVRSRHSEGTEGTDFARSRRQQEVLLAIRSKAANAADWMGMLGRFRLIRQINGKTKTDMTLSEMLSYGKIISEADTRSINRIAIEQLFENPPEESYDGKYVLIPREDYAAVHTFIGDTIRHNTGKK